MNYIKEIQRVIEYIEEDINFEEVAKEISMSSFYFHRIFSSILGISPTTYIRNRRNMLSFSVKSNWYFTNIENRENIENNRISLEIKL